MLKSFSLLLMIAISVHPATASVDPILERGLFEDTSHRLSIDEAVTQTFLPIGRILARGHSASTFWFRLRIRPTKSGAPLLLVIRPAHLDDVTLFEPTADPASPWHRQVTGALIPFAQRA
jgi:7TMR-DISM extracellular 2